jgi:hypothetical protein
MAAAAATTEQMMRVLANIFISDFSDLELKTLS